MNGFQLIKFYLIGMILVNIGKEILADQCYFCTAGTAACNDPFNAGGTGVSKVALGATNDGSACTKTVIKDSSGTITTSRGVGLTCPTGTCTGFSGYTTTSYSCIKDLCNSAPVLKNFKTTALALTILSSLISIKLFL